MKIARILIAILFCTGSVFAQDSTQIRYSEIQDTLVKQRFIDRYENVFMTKVPTRHMFKVGISQYYQAMPFPLSEDQLLTNSPLHLGYEGKISRAFSMGLSVHLPFFGSNDPLKSSWQYAVVDAQLRWFFDMNKRINAGKAANNFSGNYLALNYTIPGMVDFLPTYGVKLGFQRRFFNRGFMDFAVALQQSERLFSLTNLAFSSQTSFGLAFGDWKNLTEQPFCDILLCDADITRHLKVKLPELTFGYYLNRIRAGIAYEQKIKDSPLTLNFQFDIGLSRGFNYFQYKWQYPYYENNGRRALANSKEIYTTLSIQPRYYFLNKTQQLKGKGGSGLSGPYAGLNLEYSFYSGRHGIYRPEQKTVHIKNSNTYIGPMLGFQQRVFKNGYIDLNTSYNYKREFYSSENSFGFRGNLSVGLAF